MVFENKKINYKRDFMILNILKINDYYKVVFTQRRTIKSNNYTGLMFFSFTTKNDYLFNNFKNYGKWLNEKNKERILLLYLFEQSKQNTTPYNFLW